MYTQHHRAPLACIQSVNNVTSRELKHCELQIIKKINRKKKTKFSTQCKILEKGNQKWEWSARNEKKDENISTNTHTSK